MNNPLDEIDLELLMQRDQRAMEQWVRAYNDILYTYVFYRVAMQADIAADVVQDTFIRAIEKLKEYDPQRGSMYTWLTYLSRSSIRKTLKSRRKFASHVEFWQEVDVCLLRAYGLIATEPLPQEVLQSRETADLVRMTLANIPGNYCCALTEHYCHKKPIKEIAVAMGVSDEAAKSMLYRARQAFKVAFLRLSKPSDGSEAVRGM